MTPPSSSQIFLKFHEIVTKMTQFDECFEYRKIIEVFQMTERRPDGATIQKFLELKRLGRPLVKFSYISAILHQVAAPNHNFTIFSHFQPFNRGL